jgi:hypothetical protein
MIAALSIARISVDKQRKSMIDCRAFEVIFFSHLSL